MSSDEPFLPPKKKHSILWWIGGILVMLVMLFVFQLFGPSPSIVVSPQTTYITEPLGPDGLPDYEQYVLDLYREGVTPENNAAVLLWQALFPAEVDPQHFAAMAAELGLEQVPSTSEALAPVDGKEIWKWLASVWPNQENFSDVDAYVSPIVEQTRSRAWSSQQIPPLAAWVIANQKPLDLIVDASKLPRYYAPSPTLINGKPDLLIEMLLPQVQAVREAGRALTTRAMWHLGEGRPEAAWQDLLALHRLSHLLTQGHTLVEQLVAIAMSGMACEGTVSLLHEGQLTVEQARQIEQDLASLPSFAVMARSLDQIERASALNAFIRVGTGGGAEMMTAISGVQDNEYGNNVFNIISVDWNLVLVETNRWYDRLAAAAALPDRQARATALAQIDADIQMLFVQSRSPAQLAAGIFSRHQRSKVVSSMLLGLFLPALDSAIASQDRANTELQLTRLAAALAVYRGDHGAYPTKLDELVPGALEKLPVELYNAKPFLYKREGDGYLLYSPGENGADDAGNHEKWQVLEGQRLNDRDDAEAQNLQSRIPPGSDDISLRVPRPPLEVPKLISPRQ